MLGLDAGDEQPTPLGLDERQVAGALLARGLAKLAPFGAGLVGEDERGERAGARGRDRLFGGQAVNRRGIVDRLGLGSASNN